jgi:hypothetical protein
MFNQSQYPSLIEQGLLPAQYLRNNHLSAPETQGEPRCTHAQMIRYFNEQGQWVVEVFQYLRPDAQLGASGRPDPKRLRLGQVIYIADPEILI